MRYKHLILVFLVISSCNQDESKEQYVDNVDRDTFQYFTSLDESSTGIDFRNEIIQNDTYNILAYDGLLQGAGVGILDFNNDDLLDIYFCGNMVSDRLYLNKGNLEFEDITTSAGINTDEMYSSGVTIVDVNGDGYDDIYVNGFILLDENKRRNKLYINNKNGTFKDETNKYGIGDSGYSIMSNFFDYDRDGDLDLYVVNQPPNVKSLRDRLKPTEDTKRTYGDKFYINEDGKFIESTEQAGLINLNYSLSATTFDYNNDGWTDIYVAADYEEPDCLYKNQGDGTFINVVDEAVKHMSNFSMGADFTDINNDGLQDIYVADMVAEDNYRLKTNMSGMNPQKFWGLVNAGYHLQYMFNALQLNNGNETFSEIAQFSGISNTDWSWSPLFIDVNLDGFDDLFVTNGLMLDVRNNDFSKKAKAYTETKRIEMGLPKGSKTPVKYKEIVDLMPSNRVQNYAFKNNGDLSFDKVSETWGLDFAGWSQGSAYGDLDNDGDLDLVINNVGDAASVLKNNASDIKHNYLNIRLEGNSENSKGLNAKVEITVNGKTRVKEMTPYRGYMSSSQPIVQFGLGNHSEIEEVKITWADNTSTIISNPETNTTLKVKHRGSTKLVDNQSQIQKLFRKSPSGIRHYENVFDDYANEVLLPYKLSTDGPCSLVSDFNKDGVDDFFIGGASSTQGQLYISGKGTYALGSNDIFIADQNHEDSGVHTFDFDGDGDLDLYVASGSNEFSIGSKLYQDRLYVNDGQGNFSKSNALPIMKESTAAVTSHDIDNDGDLDLFVGGRSVPSQYGQAASSYILINEKGKFVDATKQWAPSFAELGMVKSAVWSDLDGDNVKELIVTGEWMPIEVYAVSDNKLEKRSSNLEKSNGWWNKIKSIDIDGDGDQDLVAGNLGLNIKYKASESEPFKLYVDDFDGNGTNDVYLGYFDKDGKCYPVRGRQCSSQQMPFILDKYENYDLFAKATIDEVLDDKMEESSASLEAYNFANGVFENNGKGQFTFHKFPNRAQLAPVNGIVHQDINNDGRMDLFVAGNLYDREVETTRSDAGTGLWLLNQGNFQFEVMGPDVSGIDASKDVRNVHLLNRGNQKILMVVSNNDMVDFYVKS